MCFVPFDLDRGLLINNCILDWLSWCRILCSTVYPCASMTYFVHNACGRISSVLTIYVFVELLVFGVCLLQILDTAPLPRVNALPRYLLQSSCTWYNASINQFSVLNLSTSSVSFMFLFKLGILASLTIPPSHPCLIFSLLKS